MDLNNIEVNNTGSDDFIKKTTLLLAWAVEVEISNYRDKDNKNRYKNDYKVRLTLFSLFNHLKPWLINDLSQEDFNQLSLLIDSRFTDDLFRAYDVINSWLFTKKFTDIFKRRVIL